jgi:LacI family transcriptional regulator
MREVLERRDDTNFHDMRFEPELSFTEHLRALWAGGQYPTAFFCAHDGLAVTVVTELLRLGRRIPEDVSVVGFGDYTSATQISPPLTTVTLQGFERGQFCVRLLDDRLKQRLPKHPIRIMLTGELIRRASSGPRAAV